MDESKINTYAGVFIEMLLYKWFCPFVTYIKVSISAFQVKVQCWKSVLSNEFWTAQQRIFCRSLGPILVFAGWRTEASTPDNSTPFIKIEKLSIWIFYIDLTVLLLRYFEKATKIWKNLPTFLKQLIPTSFHQGWSKTKWPKHSVNTSFGHLVI